MDDCLFCSIVNKKIPADIIYEDNESLVFLDIQPINPGHALVIPKKHATNIFDIPDETLTHLALVNKKIATVIKDALNADGINVYSNNDGPAGQVIFHAHTHIIPRYINDGYPLWKGDTSKANNNKEIAEKIKSVL